MRAGPRHLSGRPGWAVALLAGGLALTAAPAGGVITTVTNNTGSSNYQLALRVGSPAGVDTVSFSVTGNNVALNPQPVVGAPAIDVWVLPLRPAGNTTTARPVTLMVDSSSPLQCQTPATCGTTTIPFNKISWVASNSSGAGAGDITNSTFSGGAGQQIAAFDANTTYCTFWLLFCWNWAYQTDQLSATRLTFSYANDVIYPAGTYQGTVRFTATLQ